MKIVKTCKAGSRLFDRFPDWLYKVTKRVEQLSTKDAICHVWKERYEGSIAFHFELREQQLRAVVVDHEQRKTATIVLLRRDKPRFKDPMRPPMDVVWTRELSVATPDELEVFATYLACHFERMSPYPLKEEDKVPVSILAHKLWNDFEKGSKIFCGEILEFEVDAHKAKLIVKAVDYRGNLTTSSKVCYVSQLKGAKLAVGNWALFEPVGGKDRVCITNTVELHQYFRFETEQELRKSA